MVTLNVEINTEWQEVEMKLVSNSTISLSGRSVWFWVGTTAPTDNSKGHILNTGQSLSSDLFDDGDSVWFKSDDKVILTVTR